MGVGHSSLSELDLENMKALSSFDEDDLKILYRKFQTLDKDKSGSLSVDEFLMIPELAGNPLLQRIVSIFDADKNSTVEFSEFISALSTFHSGSKEDKLKFIFKMYDIDGDGYISNGELFKVLKMMVGSNLTDVQLQQLVDQTMLKVDTNRLGKVSFEEFCKHASQGKLDAMTWDTQKARDSMSAITRKTKTAADTTAHAAAAATATPTTDTASTAMEAD